jgi:hypothetical protein
MHARFPSPLVGEGGEAAHAAEPGEGFGVIKSTVTPHPVLAFDSDHPLPQGERGRKQASRYLMELMSKP